jgi:CheY-like chemotaxis protein
VSGKVLVVEDDDDIRECLADVLAEEGYAVETAQNGREALERLQRFRPCVILLDLMMPVMDGWELLAELRNDGDWSTLPVVAVSAANEAKAPEGVRQYLRKPVPINILLHAVKSYCE